MDWFRTLISIVVLGGLCVWLLASAAVALRTGRANAAGTIVDRGMRPGFFTLTVIVQFGFAATALGLLVSILAERLQLGP